MTCNSALQKAYHQHCIICGKLISYGNYETIRTKASTNKKIKYPAKTHYLHTECYNKEYSQKLPIYDIR